MPVTIDPLDKLAISVSEKIAIAKYSCGPKDSATFASEGAMNINAAIDRIVPMKEKTMAMPSAFAPSPFSIIGPPSKVVAIDDGVPGILRRMAAIKPPDVAPTNSATSSDIPAAGLIP